MKIWFQKHTIIGRNPWLDETYPRHAKAMLEDRAEVTFVGLPDAVYDDQIPAGYVRFGQIEVFFSWYFASQAVKAEREGYDAYVIGTSQDPGLAMARSLVSIPVLAYGETAFTLARTHGLRFGVVGFIPELEEALTTNIRALGLMDSCVGFQYLEGGRDLVTSATRDGRTDALAAAMDEAAATLRKKGAQCIVPGEGLPNEMLWAAGIHEVGGLPVIDCDGLVLLTAEMHARARKLHVWAPDDDSYDTRRAPDEVIDRMTEIFSPGGGRW